MEAATDVVVAALPPDQALLSFCLAEKVQTLPSLILSCASMSARTLVTVLYEDLSPVLTRCGLDSGGRRVAQVLVLRVLVLLLVVANDSYLRGRAFV